MAKTAERRLHELLSILAHHRRELDRERPGGRVSRIENLERAVALDHWLIRSHCEKHGLAVPMDIPAEG